MKHYDCYVLTEEEEVVVCVGAVFKCSFFIDNTCYFLLSGFDLQKQVLECLESCDWDAPPN